MSKAKTFSEFVVRSRVIGEIKEGGHALSVGTSRITQRNAVATIAKVRRDIAKMFKLQPDDIDVIGSAGKKLAGSTSGDLDMGVSTPALMHTLNTGDVKTTSVAIAARLDRVYPESRILMAGNIVSFAMPIVNVDGSQPNELVQCDLMLTPDVNYAKFGYHSPREADSQYKGLYRNHILFAIAQHADPEDSEEEADGSIVRTRLWFDTANGLMYGKQRVTPAGKKIMIGRQTLSRDPRDVVKVLLGPGFTVKDTDSFETLWKAINSSRFVYRRQLPSIVATIRDELKKEKVPMPQEMGG